MLDEKKALKHIEFMQLLRHTGDFYGRPFVLLPWEHEVIWDFYGTVNERGLRQYHYGYLEIPKKNGKTEVVAGLGLDHLVNDPPGGQIYCCAAERGQAALVYKAAVQMIEQDSSLDAEQGGILKILDSKNEIHNIETGNFLRVLSAEAYSKHGLNPSVIIFDELHAQPNRDLWDVMTFGSGAARKEQVIWVITTAGDDPDRKSIGWEIHEYARKVSTGEIIDPTWYVKIFGAPEGADIYDEALWHQVNPSLGVSIDIENVRQEALKARNSESAERLFRWLRLNQWIAVKSVGWLPITLWDQTIGSWSRAELKGKYCYTGIDLSSRIDLTALFYLFPPQPGLDEWRFFVDPFMPENNIDERVTRDHVPYDVWAKKDFIHTTPGNVVDFAYIKNHIERLEMEYKIKHYCGDPWHLEILRQLLPRQISQKFIEIPQTLNGMSPAMKEFERLMRGKLISHEANPCGRWAFGNVVVRPDGNDNIKPLKDRAIEKIDPIVAGINAMAGAVKLEKKTSAYQDHGVRVV